MPCRNEVVWCHWCLCFMNTTSSWFTSHQHDVGMTPSCSHHICTMLMMSSCSHHDVIMTHMSLAVPRLLVNYPCLGQCHIMGVWVCEYMSIEMSPIVFLVCSWLFVRLLHWSLWYFCVIHKTWKWCWPWCFPLIEYDNGIFVLWYVGMSEMCPLMWILEHGNNRVRVKIWDYPSGLLFSLHELGTESNKDPSLFDMFGWNRVSPLWFGGKVRSISSPEKRGCKRAQMVVNPQCLQRMSAGLDSRLQSWCMTGMTGRPSCMTYRPWCMTGRPLYNLTVTIRVWKSVHFWIWSRSWIVNSTRKW